MHEGIIFPHGNLVNQGCLCIHTVPYRASISDWVLEYNTLFSFRGLAISTLNLKEILIARLTSTLRSCLMESKASGSFANSYGYLAYRSILQSINKEVCTCRACTKDGVLIRHTIMKI